MASKQGGKGKSSSASRQASHRVAREQAEVRKERRIKRHAARCKTSKTKLAAANGLNIAISYPKKQVERAKERVSFGGSVVPEMRTFDMHGNVTSRPMFIIKEGVITDVLRTKVAA